MNGNLFEQLTRLREDIRVIPAKLQTMRVELSVAKTALETAKENLKDHELECLALVSAETVGDSAKLAFTNKEAREAEVNRRLRVDADYQAKAATVSKLEVAKGNCEIALGRVQDEERALERILEAVTAQIRADAVHAMAGAMAEFTALEAKRLMERGQS